MLLPIVGFSHYSEIVKEAFLKLEKECQQITVSQDEKIIPVLNRNFEIALREKEKALTMSENLIKDITNDYCVNKIREEVKKKAKESDKMHVISRLDSSCNIGPLLNGFRQHCHP